jgi:adenylate kinase family enzyme
VDSTPASPTRILVYGVTGSGKTTLAEQIGKRLGLPWYSVDDLTWEPGWIQVPTEVQRTRISAVCGQSDWVLDTAYGAWRDIPLAAADLVIGLDFPRWVSLGRLIRRTATRVVTRTRVCNGNRESIKMLCSKDSITCCSRSCSGAGASPRGGESAGEAVVIGPLRLRKKPPARR